MALKSNQALKAAQAGLISAKHGQNAGIDKQIN